MDDIAGWRERIDEIDIQLVNLFNERAMCAIEIGKIKQQKGIEIHNPERERDILRQICELNKGPLGNDALIELFDRIIEECRNIEENK